MSPLQSRLNSRLMFLKCKVDFFNFKENRQIDPLTNQPGKKDNVCSNIYYLNSSFKNLLKNTYLLKLSKYTTFLTLRLPGLLLIYRGVEEEYSRPDFTSGLTCLWSKLLEICKTFNKFNRDPTKSVTSIFVSVSMFTATCFVAKWNSKF